MSHISQQASNMTIFLPVCTCKSGKPTLPPVLLAKQETTTSIRSAKATLLMDSASLTQPKRTSAPSNSCESTDDHLALGAPDEGNAT